MIQQLITSNFKPFQHFITFYYSLKKKKRKDENERAEQTIRS